MFVYQTRGRTRVLRAARALVVKRGHADVSLREIAAAAGYSPAGLYAHFPGRKAILEGLADGVREQLGAALERAGRGVADPIERLMALGLEYVDFAIAHPAEFELLFRWTRSRRRSAADERPSPLDVVRAAMRQALGGRGGTDPELASLGLWATAHGLANLRMSTLAGFPGDFRAWCREILRAQVEGARCVSR